MPLDATGHWLNDKVVGQDEIVAAHRTRCSRSSRCRPGAPRRPTGGATSTAAARSASSPPSPSRSAATATGCASPPTASSAPACSPPPSSTCCALMRAGATDDDLAAEIQRAVGTKWAGHQINQVTFVRPHAVDEPDRRLTPARGSRRRSLAVRRRSPVAAAVRCGVAVGGDSPRSPTPADRRRAASVVGGSRPRRAGRRRLPGVPRRQPVEPATCAARRCTRSRRRSSPASSRSAATSCTPTSARTRPTASRTSWCPQNQPLVPITYDAYGDESDPGPFPIPLGRAGRGGGVDGDRHVLVVRQGTCDLFELCRAFPRRRRVGGRRRRPLRPHAERAAPARVDQRRRRRPADPARAGPLRRGGRRRASTTRSASRSRRRSAGYILPATHFASIGTDPTLPPMGLRLRLRADFDVSGSPARRG